MSRKTPPPRRLDRRVRRTRETLGDALVDLMHEKPYGEITVREVLDRAAVGRSTFYTHYRDKDDLFLSDVDEFFHAMATHLVRSSEPSRRVAPVRELFAHVAEAREFRAALIASGKIHDVLELGRAQLARGIEQRLVTLGCARVLTPAHLTATAHAHAGALFALLHWWLGNGRRESAEQMDELFHQMVWSGAGSAAKDRPGTR